MAKAFDDYSSFKIERVEPSKPPKQRRFKLSLLLLLLILGWALLLHGLERSGALSTLLNVDIPTQLRNFIR